MKTKWQLKAYCNTTTWCTPYVGVTHLPGEYSVVEVSFLCFTLEFMKYCPEEPTLHG